MRVGVLTLPASQDGIVREDLKLHKDKISCLSYNRERTLLATSSSDNTAKLLNVETLEALRTFTTDRPVNAIALSPILDHVMLGGGQEAITVTTTSSRQGKFEVRFFSAVYGDEFGRVSGHFGPVNTLAFHPDGTGFVSGAEDGYIRLHYFDKDYFGRDAGLEEELKEFERLEEEEKAALEAEEADEAAAMEEAGGGSGASEA